MKIKVYPSACIGTIRVPPSKSLAHRALLCAGLSEGTSEISGISNSEDIAATCGALEAFGVRIEHRGSLCFVSGHEMPDSSAVRAPLDCHESGSTLRFLIPLAALGDSPVRFTGHGRLMERPQSVYEKLFSEQGLLFQRENGTLTVCGKLHGGSLVLDGSVSSQFITGLLFALPLLQEDSRITILPPFQSRGYVDLTLDMLRQFGVCAYFEGKNTLIIPGGQRYRARNLSIEGDYSQAAFFALLSAVRGGLTLCGLRRDSLQGDRVLLEILEAFGAGCVWSGSEVRFLPAPLFGQRIDVSNCPDLAPALTVLGLYSEGTTELVNAARLRDKESDRIESMECELKKLGARVESTRDTLTVHGWGTSPTFSETELDGHNDHRVVMSLTVAALLGSAPLMIDGAEAVRKSYPDFFEDLRNLGAHWEVVS